MKRKAKQTSIGTPCSTRRAAYILQRLGELGFPEVESHIREELSFVPHWWQNRYNLTRGSTHGLSHKLTQMAYLRPAQPAQPLP